MHGEPRTSVVSAWQGRDSWRRQKTKLRRVEPCSIEGSKPPLTPILFLQLPARKPSDDRFNRPQFPEAPSRFHVVGPIFACLPLPSHPRSHRLNSFSPFSFLIFSLSSELPDAELLAAHPLGGQGGLSFCRRRRRAPLEDRRRPSPRVVAAARYPLGGGDAFLGSDSDPPR